MLQESLGWLETQTNLLLQHSSFVKVPPYQCVLLIRPEGEEHYAEVTSAEDSESLLATMKETMASSPDTYDFAKITQEVRRCYDQTKRVDTFDFLEQLGYYKYPHDPAVPQSPFERFGDLSEEPDEA
jgi:hypothetical protein